MIIRSLPLVFRPSEDFQPLLGHFHAGAFSVSSISPGFPRHNGVAHGGVFLRRVLQGVYFPGDLFGQYREPVFPDHLHLVVRPVCFLVDHRQQPLHAQRLVYPLDTPILQHGYGRGRHVDPNGAKEQEKGDTVQAAHRHITASRHFRVVVELPRPPGRVCLFELISHFHFCLEVPRFLSRDLLAALIIFHLLSSVSLKRSSMEAAALSNSLASISRPKRSRWCMASIRRAAACFRYGFRPGSRVDQFQPPGRVVSLCLMLAGVAILRRTLAAELPVESVVPRSAQAVKGGEELAQGGR